jgi:hypothetical protein
MASRAARFPLRIVPVKLCHVFQGFGRASTQDRHRVFRPQGHSGGADTEDMVRTDNITGVLPRFNPGKEFKNFLKQVVFSKN